MVYSRLWWRQELPPDANLSCLMATWYDFSDGRYEILLQPEHFFQASLIPICIQTNMGGGWTLLLGRPKHQSNLWTSFFSVKLNVKTGYAGH